MKKNLRDPFLDLSDTSTDWRLIDMDNIILHIFLQKTRDFYDLETLWSVGEQFDDRIQRPEASTIETILQKHFHSQNQSV